LFILTSLTSSVHNFLNIFYFFKFSDLNCSQFAIHKKILTLQFTHQNQLQMLFPVAKTLRSTYMTTTIMAFIHSFMHVLNETRPRSMSPTHIIYLPCDQANPKRKLLTCKDNSNTLSSQHIQFL
jgi:hypothetical protein